MRTQIAHPLTKPLVLPEAVEADYRERGVGVAVYAAAALSLAAAMAHLWVMPEHLAEWWGYGTFFLAAALAQGLFSITLLRWPSQLLAVAGILGNLSVVLLYVLTRTSGVPLGPHAGEIEGAGMLDMAATATELSLILALVTLLSDAWRRLTLNGLLLAGAAIWALRFSGALS